MPISTKFFFSISGDIFYTVIGVIYKSNNGTAFTRAMNGEIQTYYKNGDSIKQTNRWIRVLFGAFNRPCEQAIRNLVKIFEETGSVQNQHCSSMPNCQRLEFVWP